MMRVYGAVQAAVLAVVFQGVGALAQATPVEKSAPLVTQTFYLVNVRQSNDQNEVVTALRNIVNPRDKIYLVPSQDAIVVSAPADEMPLMRKLLNDLDRPKKTYRLTYSITEMDGGRRVGVQRFGMIVASREKSSVKQGSRVPVVTGGYESGASAPKTQVTYLDVGLTIEASLDESVDGVTLRSNVERSSVAEENSGAGPQDPVIRRTSVEGTASLVPGKPMILGSLDVLGSTRHLEVEVVAEVAR